MLRYCNQQLLVFAVKSNTLSETFIPTVEEGSMLCSSVVIVLFPLLLMDHNLVLP